MYFSVISCDVAITVAIFLKLVRLVDQPVLLRHVVDKCTQFFTCTENSKFLFILIGNQCCVKCKSPLPGSLPPDTFLLRLPASILLCYTAALLSI